jgi:hypothetical protein
MFARAPRSLYRVDTRDGGKAELLRPLSWREADCGSVVPDRPNVLVCAAFELVSDAWMIEDFNRR